MTGTYSTYDRWQKRAHNLNNRARQFGARGRVNGNRLRGLVKEHGSRCAWCYRRVHFGGWRGRFLRAGTFDHVVPLNAGGPGRASNIVPSCLECNWSRNRVDIAIRSYGNRPRVRAA